METDYLGPARPILGPALKRYSDILAWTTIAYSGRASSCGRELLQNFARFVAPPKVVTWFAISVIERFADRYTQPMLVVPPHSGAQLISVGSRALVQFTVADGGAVGVDGGQPDNHSGAGRALFGTPGDAQHRADL